MRHARQSGDITAAVAEAQRLLAPALSAELVKPELGRDLRALALINLGIAELWTSRFDEADRHLADGIALAQEIGRPYLEVTGLAFWAQLTSWRSFPLGAARGLQAIDLATKHGWSDEPVTGVAYLALGVAMVAQGQLEEAERALGRAERTIRTEAEPAAGMRLRYGRGMLEFVSGRHDAALRAFQAAERLSASLRTPHTLAPRLRSHLLQTLTRAGANRARRAGPDRDGPAGPGAGRDSHRRGVAAPGAARTRARPPSCSHPSSTGRRRSRTPTSGTSRRSCSRRSPATRSATRSPPGARSSGRLTSPRRRICSSRSCSIPRPTCSIATAGTAPRTPG